LPKRKASRTTLIYVNPAFERLTGYTSEEILYQDCRFLQSGDRDQALIAIRDALEWRACREILRNYRKDGTPFWNELSLSTVKTRRRADLFRRCAEGRDGSGQGAAARRAAGSAGCRSASRAGGAESDERRKQNRENGH
jgi:PAS domain-containing protein